MQRFFYVIGLLTVVALMALGINSILPQGGFIIVDGERIGKWVPNEPAIILPVIEDHSSHDIEHEPHHLDYTGSPVLSAIHARSIDFIQTYRHPKSCSCCENGDVPRRGDKYDNLEGAQDFWHATKGYDNIRDGAHRDDLIAITAAIRYAEGGSPSLEYGVKTNYARGISSDAKGSGYSGYRLQVGACAWEVQRRWDGYLKDGGDSRDMYGFVSYLGDRYCPTEGATDDPTGLNQNWKGHVDEARSKLLEGK